MIQKDKELLLKDLCARLPYDVKGRVYAETTNGKYDINGDMIFFDSPFDVTLDNINISTEEIHVIAIGNEDTIDFIEDQQTWGDPYTIDDFKPYLRPMSSMTDEECMELSKIRPFDDDVEAWKYVKTPVPLTIANIKHFDFFHSHHLDWRGLIEKGLALEAPEGMYN